MDYPDLSTWVSGGPEDSPLEDGTIVDPNTGEVLAANRASSLEQVDRAVAAAHAEHADGAWFGLGPTGRAEILLAWADWLDAHADAIARLDALNSGVPIAVTSLFAGANGATVRKAARLATERGDATPLPSEQGGVVLRHVPWGATALIAPWNAPSAMAVKKLAYALAAGAPAIIKPSPASPWSTEIVVQGLHEVGVPAGVANLVLGGGGVGEVLVADPRIRAIAMTGSMTTGRRIAATAATRFVRLRLELGSNNAAVVRSDADVAEAAKVIAAGALKLSGQWCEAPRRVIAHRGLTGELTDALVAEFAKTQIGSSLEPGTEVGPVAFEARLRELTGQIADLEAAGNRAMRTADVPDRGWFLSPTVVVGERPIPDGELFGPVLTVEPFDTEDEAIVRANTGHTGLAGYVLTRDVEAGLALGSRLEAGEIKVNGSSLLDMSPGSAQSFFGDSGIGGHGDSDVLDFFSGKQVLGTDQPGLSL